MNGILEVNDGRITNYKPGIGFFSVIVGQACNFKCRDCANFCPHMPKELQRYDVEKVINDLRIVLDSVAIIDRIQIQGGEPFIYSDLDKLVKYIGTHEKVNECIIATNGSITPSDELMSVLRDNGALVRISNYGLFPEKIERLKSKCDEFGVAYSSYDFSIDNALWFDLGGVNITPPPVCRG